MLLQVIFMALLPVLEPQEIRMLPEVDGYLRHDVTLPCQFIPGPLGDKIVQLQWMFKSLKGEEIRIIVFSSENGVNILETYLKQRLKLDNQSLTITEVEKKDAGLYTCNIAAFPSGSLVGTTNLVVYVMAAITYYLIFIRRFSVRHHVCIDTRSPDMDVNRPPVDTREDVVYSDVKPKPSRDAVPSTGKHTDTARPDDITYSAVAILRPQKT
ncbi:nectin-1-like isoform X2 [Antennarius striatus]|uniref:nectin-1-like isoform X2 n=1 Tax=Antennarius striatus TaxID=241820 RepID=UPI0035B1F64D